MTRTGEKIRDYSHEYNLRKKQNKRIHADMKTEIVDKFREHLQNNNITFVKWLEQKIYEEMKGN